MTKEQPTWKWWMMNATESCPTLRPLAIKLLDQCFLNSSFKHNWNIYKYVHSIIHIWLLADRAKKLVYMYCNEKILNILKNQDYEEGMPIWMYNCSEKNDDDSKNIVPNDDVNKVAFKIEITMNLAFR